MSEIDDLRASMRAAQPSGKGQYIEQGRHELEIKNCFVKRSTQEGRIKETWICEFTVITSTNPSHEPGSTRSYAENPENAGWMGRFKSFLTAAVGVPSNAKLSPADEQTIGDVTVALRFDEERTRMGWPENFLKGRRVLCEGMAGKSKGGIEITNKKWEPAAPVAAA
jgi:hypothetical protein